MLDWLHAERGINGCVFQTIVRTIALQRLWARAKIIDLRIIPVHSIEVEGKVVVRKSRLGPTRIILLIELGGKLHPEEKIAVQQVIVQVIFRTQSKAAALCHVPKTKI